ncbi:histidine kinase [Amycolatopsis sp. DG1A-15b]|uniref:sensor histidine kinase n=1 Tax=Amycolatopsis sp. DG1A-15b TaxID=3052846 RepID=UPI00255B97AC|nr:histidine kinase [Amycolatopsis sp. DG1A-15b]WIX84544.1 histidine kinase [Amycolatopsis sp. DG1A-15b]
MSPVAALEPATTLSATAEPRGTTGIDRRPRLASRLAAAVTTVVVVGFSVTGGYSAILAAPVGLVTGAYGIAAVLAILSIQLFHFSRPTADLRSTTSRVLLGVQALLAYLPILTFGSSWLSMPAFVAAGGLLTLRPRLAWPLFGLVTVSVAWLFTRYETSFLGGVYSTLGTVFYGLVFFVLARLVRMVNELHRARTELARHAVAEQRLAFARDLHDLLGISLSAIALKGELASRLMQKSVDRAKAELAEITAAAQRTLSDVRAVSHGYRELSLERESRTAESLLSASDVAVKVHLDQADLPVQARTLLAKVLREGVTNVLRYSDVEHCEIDVRQQDGTVSLDIVNDGMTADDLPPESGKLLTRLPDEVRALGGQVSIGTAADGRFRLHVELPAMTAPETTVDDVGRQSLAESKWIGRLLPVVFVVMSLGVILHLLLITTEAWEIALVTGSILGLLVLQFSYFDRPTMRLRSAQSYGMLFVQACLIYLPLLPLQQHWVSLPSLLIGSALLVMPPAAGWPFFVLNVALYAWAQGVGTLGLFYAIFFTAATVMSSLTVFSLLWLVRLVAELDSTRRRLAETAVAEERLRFARDLHDLLGMSLSAIALKSELTARVLPLNQARAAEELREVMGLTRQALSDVRSVASGYRELSLDSESQTARSVLAAADVRVRMEMLDDELPVPVRTVLAVVLREGVTNVLRHSRVESCEIALRRTDEGVSLDIVNDGVKSPPAGTPEEERAARPEPHRAVPRDTSPGSGIGNLSQRVADLGGELTAGVEPDGRFRLRAAVPV